MKSNLPMKTDYKQLLESALETLKMISTAQVFNDGNDRMISINWRKLADSEVRLIENIIETNKIPKRDLDQEREERIARTQREMDEQTDGHCGYDHPRFDA